MQSASDKSGPPKAEEVVRAYDTLIGHVKELSEIAARLGGSAGETLLEECTAQACSPLASYSFLRSLVHTKGFCYKEQDRSRLDMMSCKGIFQQLRTEVKLKHCACDVLTDSWRSSTAWSSQLVSS